MAMSPICSFENCSKKSLARDMCSMHYSRWRRSLTVAPEPFKRTAPTIRFIKECAVPYSGDDCLTWPFNRDEDGYGKLTYKGSSIRAHRLVCKLSHGPSPSIDHIVAHSCGNGHLGCVNPKHLRWATQKENAQDKYLHGRCLGEKHPNSKLKNADVLAIYAAKGRTKGEVLAKTYNVSQSAIYMIWNGSNYRSVTQS